MTRGSAAGAHGLPGLLLFSAVGVASCTNFAAIAGYTPVSDVGRVTALGQAIEAVDAAIDEEPRDWTAAVAAYENATSSIVSLRNVLPSPANGRTPVDAFTAHYGSDDYMHEFVSLALRGEGKFALEGKLRKELAMKGIVLQGVLMASMTSLHDAVRSCREGNAGDFDGAPHYVDYAWALYACSEAQGPIRLAEKRAPQFDVEATHKSEAGGSKVNVRLLALFETLQASAQQGNCVRMQELVPKAIALMQVPVIQGMLREAYEVDPKEVEEHRGADGFVEVAEGWAFTRAVLPAIGACSAEAADTIQRNMDTLGLGPQGPHIPDGYEAVKAAVESTYPCLGISCADVNAMVDPWKTGQLLWVPCSDAALTTTTQQVDATGDADVTSGAKVTRISAWNLVGAVIVVGSLQVRAARSAA